MKKSIQVVGLPIISISEGQEIGNVKSLVINPDKGSVDFLTIEHEDWQVSVKAIPFKKVVGIGEYAVTVESENAVIDLNEIPIANQLVNKKIKITGTKVMTRKGQLIGEIGEFFIDEDNGFILGAQLNASDREVVLDAKAVLTFGKDIIIVNEDAQSYFLDSAEQLQGEKASAEINANGDESVHNNASMDDIEGDLLEEMEQKDGSEEEIQSIKEKQVEILKNKRVLKDIYDNEGNLLFSRGSTLQEEDIMKAQEAGPSIVVELSMNVDSE